MNPQRLLTHFDRIAEAPDAVPRLRRFILDLAVRGRLVEQDPADEPPVEQLKQARQRLEKAAESTKRLRWNPSLAITIIDSGKDLPRGWLPARVNDTGLYINGLAFKPSDWKQEGLPIIRIQNLTDPSREFNFAEGDFPDEVLVRDGDILISWSATLEAFNWDRGPGVLNQHIFRVIPDEGLAARDFLLLLLRHAIREMADSEHAHGLVMSHINRGPFLDHIVLIPPLAEQHRIVAKVDELMALCDRLEAAQYQREQRRDRLLAASLNRINQPAPSAEGEIATAFREHARFHLAHLPRLTTRPEHIKALRQTILNLAVRGKLLPQDPADEPASELLLQCAAEIARGMKSGQISAEKPAAPLSAAERSFDLPVGWEWVRLGALVQDSDSGWSPRTENHPREGDAWGILKVSAVSWERFDPSANKQVLPGTESRLQAQVHKGDFLISRANTAELIARAVLVEGEPRNLMMSDKIVRLRLTSRCDHRYVWRVNNHADFARAYYARNATGVSPSMKNVPRRVILDLPLPLPPLAEQHRIVAKVDELMAVCDQLEASLAATQTDSRRLLEAVLQETLAPAMEKAP